ELFQRGPTGNWRTVCDHDEPPDENVRPLWPHPEVHHAVLCAAIQRGEPEMPATTQAAPHNRPVRIIEAGGPRIGVPGQVLHLVEGNTLLQQVGDRRHPERVWREVSGEAGVLK